MKSATKSAPSNAPAKTFRFGRIQAAVWANTSDDGQKTYYNVTFSRSFQDENEKWHDSDSFGLMDLLLVSKLADMAHTWISEQLAGESQ